jgi:nitrite reductase/ring-hydroxylating ferredoxin subunit
MSDTVNKSEASLSLQYSGYHRKLTAEPDRYLTQTGRGTPGGEYLRRFWWPVAYLHELTDLPLRIRVLGEDLVAFRDGSGRIGVLHLHCCHRRTSLEFGLISERGIRCCYHGRVFDVDGTILDMPGEPNLDRLKKEVSQGAYPVHVFGPLVYIYMGPPEKKPLFPPYDRLVMPGMTIIPGGPRLPFPCNWIQIKENSMDPAHTAVLHAIPQIKGVDHFANEFEEFPEFAFTETPVGTMYVAVRRVDDNIWVRSADALCPTMHCITSIFESGRQVKKYNLPFRTIFTTPVDDEHSINFPISHIPDGEPMPDDRRRYLELFGQTDERPYAERQNIPGDYDAMVSEGPIEVHSLENLGALDAGVTQFRRRLRRSIEAVERGEDPPGVYFEDPGVIYTYASDRVVPVAELGGDPDDRTVLRNYAKKIADEYLASPPLVEVMRERMALK